MGFHLINGNDLTQMGAVFAGLALQKGDPFAEDTVVITDSSVRRWLAVTVARRCGFCPDMEFIRPGEFIYKYLFNPAQGKRVGYDTSGFEPTVTVWTIYDALADVQAPRVVDYVRGSPLRRWQLATKLAGIYDQYMTYRQDYLAAWQDGGSLADESGEVWPDEAWQADLWRKLTAGRTDTFAALCRRCLVPDFPSVPHGRRFFYFGMAALPLVHLRAAMKVAEANEVYFFMLNPCAELWNDVKSKRRQIREDAETPLPEFYKQYYASACNRLLGDMALAGRDYFATLLDVAWDAVAADVFYPHFPDTVLGRMRRDVQNNSNASAVPPAPGAPFDPSFAVHVCFSPQREVEVLKDQLLLAFKTLPGLRPMDVRVYVPDLETYGPFIEAVFGQTEAGTPQLPYRLVGKGLSDEFPEFRVFGQLLDLIESRFKAVDVVEFLAAAPVSERLGLDPQEANRAGQLVAASCAVWGLDARHKAAMGGAATDRNSWRFALDRLILGVACPDPDLEAAPFGTAPGCVPEAEAEGQAKVVGALARTLRGLARATDAVSRDEGKERTAEAWSAFLLDLMEEFLPARGGEGLIELRRLLASLPKTVELAGVNPVFPFAVVKAWFKANQKTARAFPNSLSGAVTFAPIPSSGVALPARVVAFLGLNDGTFPARDKKEGFNLLLKKHRMGDPSNRGRDRYAFLQTFMSAQDRVLVTYTGFSQKDKSELPPSIVVSELLDAAAPYGPAGKDSFVVVHPLHPFSKAYFEEGAHPLLLTFSPIQRELAQTIRDTDGVPRAEPDEEIPEMAADAASDAELDFDEVVKAFKDPHAYFVTHTLGASLQPREEAAPLEAEPVELDALQTYCLNSDLLSAALAADGSTDTARLAAAQRVFRSIHARGGLPVACSWTDCQPTLAALLTSIPAGPFAERTATFVAGDTHVRAHFDRLGQEEDAAGAARTVQLIVHPSADTNGKTLVAALLHHLALNAVEPEVATRLVTQKNVIEFHALAPGDAGCARAREILARVLTFYRELARHPIPFDPDVFWKDLCNGDVPTAESTVDAVLAEAFLASTAQPQEEA